MEWQETGRSRVNVAFPNALIEMRHVRGDTVASRAIVPHDDCGLFE
jgi:hypothetical protein